MGEAYGTRPSSIIGIKNDWVAFQFDEACLVVGREYEKEMMEERNHESGVGSRREYSRPPMERIKKRKIKPNGTW